MEGADTHLASQFQVLLPQRAGGRNNLKCFLPEGKWGLGVSIALRETLSPMGSKGVQVIGNLTLCDPLLPKQLTYEEAVKLPSESMLFILCRYRVLQGVLQDKR